MAAVTAVMLGQLRAGDHVVAAQALFGSCRWVIEELLPRFGVPTTLVDGADLDAWRAAVRPNTKTFFLESPANPTLSIVDIAAVGEDRARGGRHPRGRQRLRHADLPAPPGARRRLRRLLGHQAYRRPRPLPRRIILASQAFIDTHIHNFLRQTGPALSPFNAWVLLKGLETLPLRVRRQTESAAAVADALATHRRIARLFYPGRADHPQADVVRRQMSGGSTLVSFEVDGGKDEAFRFQNALRLVRISNNLGDAKSLITHPATTTHQRFTPEVRAAMGVSDGLVRLSIGLEHPQDLIDDLTQALAAV